MVGMVVMAVTFTLLVTLLLAALLAVTVVPMFVSLQMADARRFSTARCLAFSAATVLAGIGYAYVLHGNDAPRLVQLLPLGLTWAGPGALWLLEAGQWRYGGRAGEHE